MSCNRYNDRIKDKYLCVIYYDVFWLWYIVSPTLWMSRIHSVVDHEMEHDVAKVIVNHILEYDLLKAVIVINYITEQNRIKDKYLLVIYFHLFWFWYIYSIEVLASTIVEQEATKQDLEELTSTTMRAPKPFRRPLQQLWPLRPLCTRVTSSTNVATLDLLE